MSNNSYFNYFNLHCWIRFVQLTVLLPAEKWMLRIEKFHTSLTSQMSNVFR
jgi:hypothetical protein